MRLTKEFMDTKNKNVSPFLSMIIDDSSIDTLILKHSLKMLDCGERVLHFSFAKKALDYLREVLSKDDLSHVPDYIFLDLNMPAMNGKEFLEEFEKLPEEILRKVKIIMMSNSFELSDISTQSHTKNILKFIIKPVEEKDLDFLLGLR
jgi:two-component SAPR family response regulator